MLMQVDWVTIGVLARKTISKAATNGSTFMVWALSDLERTELSMFLFGDAYNTHWKVGVKWRWKGRSSPC